MPEKEKLFDQFPPVSRQKWLDKINDDLKGADFSEKLIWKTNEGFEVSPLYTQEDIENLKYIDSVPGEFPYLRGSKTTDNTWKIRQDIAVRDYSEANSKALDLLSGGIDSLGFIIVDPESVNEENIDTLLENIYPELTEVNFLSEGKAKEIFQYFRVILKKGTTNPEKITGAIETDPLSRLMLNGTLCIPVEKGFDYLAELSEMTSVFPGFRTIHINASNFGNGGANLVQELAFAISMGTEYMSQLLERGIDAEVAASKIRFSFGIGSDFFSEIARLRAARLLWSTVMNGFLPGNEKSAKMEMHCITSRWNLALYDPYMNILRTQSEAMAAILGGTNSLTVLPFDVISREPNDFSERLARNQQLILKEEAYFDRVADPAAGSYYIENLTSLMADNAWRLFLETESNGGFLESLKKGFIQKKVNESASKLKSDILKQKINFVGTTIYPVHGENIPQGIKNNILFPEKPAGEDKIVEPIKLFRGPSLFENLQMKTGNKE
jgi:methylmalonyl-CoA mutase